MLILETCKKNHITSGSKEWNEIIQDAKNHFADKVAKTFVIMDSGVCLGSFVDGEFNMPKKLPLLPEYVRKVRLFNNDSELHIWRSDSDEPNIFHFRLRVDIKPDNNNDEEVQEYYKAYQLLWGTLEVLSDDENWVVLKEDRGIELLVKCSILRTEDIKKNNRLWLVTHNYIGYNEIGQAGFNDCRFVDIVGEEVIKV